MKRKKITFTAPLTHSDWYGFDHKSKPEWDENGVRSMLV